MRPWNGAGGVRSPELANSFPNSFHGLASPHPRRNRGGMYAIPPHRVTRETSAQAGVANRLADHISGSEIDRLVHGGVGADHSSGDEKDSITFFERRVRALGMLRRDGKDWHESSRKGGVP